MSCNQCRGIEEQFDAGTARRDLKRFRKNGPNRTTRMLLEALTNKVAGAPEPGTLIDVGGGIGAIQHHLLEAGIDRVSNVDASEAYQTACREEAERRGMSDRIRYLHGDFVDLADSMPPAWIVTLDRVVCCYHDADALLKKAASRAEGFCALVYPRETWWTHVIGAGLNTVSRLRRSDFRFFVHPTEQIDAVITSHGFRLRLRRRTLLWQVVVYERQ